MAHHQRHQVNQSDNDSIEHADNENDYLVRVRAEMSFDDFINAMECNYKDDDDYAASPVPQSTEDDNLDVWQTSGDEEVRNANLEPLRRTRAELYDDSDDETSTESEEPDFKGIQRRSLLGDELETEAESSETDQLAPQDPDAKEIFNKLAPTAKKNKKIIEKQQYDQQLQEQTKKLKVMIHLSQKIVEGEKTPQYGSLIRNLVAAQSTNVQAAKAIIQKGKLEAAERILDIFEQIGQATGEAQQLSKQHLDNRRSRFSYNKPLTSAAFSSKEKKAMKEERSVNLRQVEEEAQEEEKDTEENSKVQFKKRCYINKYQKKKKSKELLKKIKKEEALFFNSTFIIPRKDKSLRKILDCRPINKFLKEDSFKSEDIKTVTQLSLIID
ncbi:MAG: hypothetical protein EZS28_003721 [Streblomastix strix]|uniref:Uncharacterized protein n=1 Tax=Streblomastix strix TaxID=222440 RepID=A0A5J4X267_9EUKA|nr:MAG: hypothetical protein EZS28_003721 [Streblomastix strix]